MKTKKNCTYFVKFYRFIFNFLLTACLLVLTQITALACPVCEKQQPKLLQGVTHGAGPEDNWDYVIVGVTMVLVVATLYYSTKWLIKPGEKSESHIKRLFIEE